MIDLSWMEKPENIKKMIKGSLVILVLLVVVDFFLEHHAAFSWAGWPGFGAVYGFLSCVVIIAVSKVVGIFLKKKEDYYD